MKTYYLPLAHGPLGPTPRYACDSLAALSRRSALLVCGGVAHGASRATKGEEEPRHAPVFRGREANRHSSSRSAALLQGLAPVVGSREANGAVGGLMVAPHQEASA